MRPCRCTPDAKPVRPKVWLWRIAAGTALLQACATSPATSQLVGERYFLTAIDTYPVQIASVDGSSSTVTPQFVEPGVRRLVLRGPPGGAGFSAVESFTLDVKPCTRYYIVAVKANRLDTAFTPKVDFEQPLGSSCRQPAP
jgi:hypothetical protein